MRNKYSGASRPSFQSNPPSGQEVDYSPRVYTLREKLIFGMKLIIISGIVVLLFWLMDRFSSAYFPGS